MHFPRGNGWQELRFPSKGNVADLKEQISERQGGICVDSFYLEAAVSSKNTILQNHTLLRDSLLKGTVLKVKLRLRGGGDRHDLTAPRPRRRRRREWELAAAESTSFSANRPSSIRESARDPSRSQRPASNSDRSEDLGQNVPTLHLQDPSETAVRSQDEQVSHDRQHGDAAQSDANRNATGLSRSSETGSTENPLGVPRRSTRVRRNARSNQGTGVRRTELWTTSRVEAFANKLGLDPYCVNHVGLKAQVKKRYEQIQKHQPDLLPRLKTVAHPTELYKSKLPWLSCPKPAQIAPNPDSWFADANGALTCPVPLCAWCGEETVQRSTSNVGRKCSCSKCNGWVHFDDESAQHSEDCSYGLICDGCSEGLKFVRQMHKLSACNSEIRNCGENVVNNHM